MPATETNQNFFELKPLWVGKVGAAGVASTVATTIPLQSAAGLTNGNAYIVTANRVTAGGVKNAANERETFIGKLSGTNFIDCVRQVEGEAQAWEADIVLEILVTAEVWNKLIEGVEVEHNPDGTHKLQKFDEARYAVDAEGDDDYVVTLSPAPTEYYAGMVVYFKANTVNTGACTIDVNELGPKAIKNPDGTDLSDGQIPDDSVVSVIYDGTNFIIQSIGGLATKTYAENYVKAPRVVALTDGATPALNASLGDIFTLSAAGNRTIAVPSNPTDGQKIIIVHHASGGARTLALNTGAGGFVFGEDVDALTATTSGKRDFIGCIYNAGLSKWAVVAVSKGY